METRTIASHMRILGRGLDTLILNIYPNDEQGDITQQRLPELLEQELNLYKERAQQLDEEVPTRWIQVMIGSRLVLVIGMLSNLKLRLWIQLETAPS